MTAYLFLTESENNIVTINVKKLTDINFEKITDMNFENESVSIAYFRATGSKNITYSINLPSYCTITKNIVVYNFYSKINNESIYVGATLKTNEKIHVKYTEKFPVTLNYN